MKISFKLLLSTMLMLTTFGLFAQTDMVRTNNGSVLYAKFIQKVDDTIFVFEFNGNTIRLNQSQIVEVKFGVKPDLKHSAKREEFKPGFYIGISGAYQQIVNKGPQSVVGVDLLPGYRFGNVYAQLRLGMDINPANDVGGMIFWQLYNPGFDIGFEKPGKVKPYIQIGAGASIGYALRNDIRTSMNGGWNSRFEGGVHFALGKRSMIGIGLTAKYYILKYTTSSATSSTASKIVIGPGLQYKFAF